ncbi:Imm8 family immunity protein [Pseudomonas frederiksbergensis]|uniref:Imm8 family immunity protein n=1 Tax=Pseudomonas frederiksbergensis TaxID=104087 RepID=UPI003D1BEE11
MEAKLKRLHSPDIYNLESYQPDVQDEFGFLLQAMIGPAGEDGEESFDMEVCTPKWIEKRQRVDEVVIGREKGTDLFFWLARKINLSPLSLSCNGNHMAIEDAIRGYG